jgi:hypothetical protein
MLITYSREEPVMEHQEHISDKSDMSPVTRILALVGILAIIAAGGAYLVYGSGLWNPQVQHAGQ